MATYLVALSFGPVQGLIAAARRTRDLWCGSWLLSEAARAAARVLHEQQPGSLVFPCPPDPDEDLLPRKRPMDEPNIANILRAEIAAAKDDEVRLLCRRAGDAAVARLAELCDGARHQVPDLPIRTEHWERQVKDILECFAAWVRIDNGDYQGASKRLGGLLAARKATRDFAPAAATADGLGRGIPKSSLDGARESVIDLDRKQRLDLRYRTSLRKLRLGIGEQLDALGLAKRRAGDPEQFTAYPRIAADPWIDALDPTQRERLSAVYKPLQRCRLATGVSGNDGIYSDFPYDAELLYDFRLDNALKAPDADEQDKQALGRLRAVLADIAAAKRADRNRLGTPVPYAVILKADGDRMGKLLSAAKTADQSRAVSKALNDFAASVRELVRNHRGHAIYAGGDDVLALVPLASAIGCAKTLAAGFRQAMKGPAERLGLQQADQPTLSVGLGIGHLMEPMSALRARADAAEQDAKGNALPDTMQRNALAIRLGIRSGGEHCWRRQWTVAEGTESPALAEMQRLSAAFRNSELPSRVPFDLRAIHRRLAWLDNAPDCAEQAPGMRAAELARLLDRARAEAGAAAVPDDVQGLLRTQAEAMSLVDLADWLIIARWLSARSAADLGET